MKGYLILFGMILVIVFRIDAFCQHPDKILDQRIDLNLSETTMLFVLMKLSHQFQVPIGLERASNYDQKLNDKMIFENDTVRWKKDTMKIIPGTLKEILDSLVKQEPDYNWELRDGVINVFPVQSRDYFLKNFLDTRVKSFSPPKSLSKLEIRDYIFEMPEAKSLLESENVTLLRRNYMDPDRLYLDVDYNISVTDSDFRGILNKIVGNSPFKFWIIERIGFSKEDLLLTF